MTQEEKGDFLWRYPIGALMILVLGCALIYISVSEDKGVNLVSDIAPVSDRMSAVVQPLQARLALAENDAARLAVMNEEVDIDFLTRMLYAHLRAIEKIDSDEVKEIAFFFGSIESAEAEDASGAYHVGYARNKLYARVSFVDPALPDRMFIVECTNGLLYTEVGEGGLQRLATAGPPPPFTVGQGENLAMYVGYAGAIQLAELHKLPVHKVVEGAQIPITYDEALELGPLTESIRVVVIVNPGDTFDLRERTYNGVLAALP